MLSATYVPARRYTYCVLYGAPRRIRDTIIKRLSVVEEFHPLVLPVMFAEIERERHFKLFRALNSKLLTRAVNIPQIHRSHSDTNESQLKLIEYATSRDTLQEWMKMSHLKNGLESWKQQLDEMISHAEDSTLTACLNGRCPDEASSSDSPLESALTRVNTQLIAPGDFTKSYEVEDSLKAMGTRISKRLRELRTEYEETIRASSTIIDTILLATQMVSTRRG